MNLKIKNAPSRKILKDAIAFTTCRIHPSFFVVNNFFKKIFEIFFYFFSDVFLAYPNVSMIFLATIFLETP